MNIERLYKLLKIAGSKPVFVKLEDRSKMSPEQKRQERDIYLARESLGIEKDEDVEEIRLDGRSE